MARSVRWAVVAMTVAGAIGFVPGRPVRGQETNDAAAKPAAAEVADGPRSIAELAPAAIPDAENAAAQIEALGALLDNWSGDYGRFSQTPLGLAYDERANRGEPPTAEQASVMQEILDPYAELDAGLQRAAACEKFVSRGDFKKNSTQFIDELLPRIQRFRSVGRTFEWRIRMLSLNGEHDDAVRRGIELLKLTRLHQNEPTMVAYLVTLAVRSLAIRELYDALAAGRVSFEAHTALDAELALIDDPATFGHMLRSERAFTLTAQEEQSGPLGLGALLNVGVGTGAGKYMAAVIASSDGPWVDFRKEARDGGKFGKPTSFGVMADSLAPAVVATVEAHGRNLAAVRSLRAFNRFRLFATMEKREATGLEELDLPAAAIADPFSDGPLKATLTEDGWLIYSVMANGVDDGGDFRDQRDYGITPPGKRRAQ